MEALFDPDERLGVRDAARGALVRQPSRDLIAESEAAPKGDLAKQVSAASGKAHGTRNGP
jgi:hypothetical protein